MAENEIVLFESEDGEVNLPTALREESVWLTQSDMSLLFGRNQSTIARHINNAFNDGEIGREKDMQKMHNSRSEGPSAYYNLDVVISVGYRVKSKRGVEFRRWATSVLKRYIVEGYAENSRRLEQLGVVTNCIFSMYPVLVERYYVR